MKFRPKIQDIINDYEMDGKLFVPKNGGLKDIVGKSLNSMGVDLSFMERIDRDNYKSENIDVLIYRAEDIPPVLEELYFKKGIKALGFTGDDLFDEYVLKNPGTFLSIIETVDWIDRDAMFGRPALCLITKGQKLEGNVNIAVNRKYEQSSKRFLEEIASSCGFNPTVNVYSGNTEGTVVEGINDACIEIVYSGNSIDRNGLKIEEVVRTSDFVLVGINEQNPLIFQRAYEQIQDRVRNPKEGSYTSKLAKDWNSIIKKIGEEDAEFISACMGYAFQGVLPSNKSSFEYLRQNLTPEGQRIIMDEMKLGPKVLMQKDTRDEMVGEFGDRLYTSMIAMAIAGIPFSDIVKQEYKRYKK